MPEYVSRQHSDSQPPAAKSDFSEAQIADAMRYSGLLGFTPATPETMASLKAHQEFPADPYYRELATRETMSKKGGEPLTPAESSELSAKREFPHDQEARRLATKDSMSEYGGPQLTPSESQELAEKRNENGGESWRSIVKADGSIHFPDIYKHLVFK